MCVAENVAETPLRSFFKPNVFRLLLLLVRVQQHIDVTTIKLVWRMCAFKNCNFDLHTNELHKIVLLLPAQVNATGKTAVVKKSCNKLCSCLSVERLATAESCSQYEKVTKCELNANARERNDEIIFLETTNWEHSFCLMNNFIE